MISKEQMERAKLEFARNAVAAMEVARNAERAREQYQYGSSRIDLGDRRKLDSEYADADYMAESRAWIHAMIVAEICRQESGFKT
jgi:hypothetical protein